MTLKERRRQEKVIETLDNLVKKNISFVLSSKFYIMSTDSKQKFTLPHNNKKYMLILSYLILSCLSFKTFEWLNFHPSEFS